MILNAYNCASQYFYFINMFIFIFCTAVLIAMFFLIKKYKTRKTVPVQQTEHALSQPVLVESFSGDNHCDTELDLAKAYLELHQHDKVKLLLKSVITHGSPSQIFEARQMFSLLLKQERSS